jgi:hypothetical protein
MTDTRLMLVCPLSYSVYFVNYEYTLSDEQPLGIMLYYVMRRCTDRVNYVRM